MIENFHHPRNRRKQTDLDHGRALFLGQVQISQDEGDMIGELDAGLDAAGLHSLLQLHQEKTAPRGYPPDHPRIGLLRHKGLIAWKEWPVEAWLGSPAARTHVAGFLVAARPLSTWLDTHVGSDGG